MSNKLNGQSLFTGINAGLTNAFAQLSGQYKDGLTLENLQKSLSNTNIINNNYNATFASYLTSNFSSFDKNGDGIISSDEIQNYMTNIATQGLTRDQIATFGNATGLSSSLQETVLNHFDEIDKNHDGKVTNQEIQSYGVESDLEKQKIADRNKMVNGMSMFYGSDTKYEGSMLDYKYLDDKNT
ncbi:MAG: EF-hand domain-containing protein [bacterium]|nr:EF-hand domain-containing protein [bacterium]